LNFGLKKRISRQNSSELISNRQKLIVIVFFVSPSFFLSLFRRNNSSSATADNSVPQISSLDPSAVPADSLIVTARTTTKELQPNILNLDNSPGKTQGPDSFSAKGFSIGNFSERSSSSDNKEEQADKTDKLPDAVTETVINLKGSVKKYMEIVRTNSSRTSASEEEATPTTTVSVRTTGADFSEGTSTTAAPISTTTPSTTAKMFTKKMPTVRSTTTASDISSSTAASATTKTTTTEAATTEAAVTKLPTEEPKTWTSTPEINNSATANTSTLKKTPLELEGEEGQPVNRVVKNIDEDAGEANQRQQENQLDSSLSVPDRPPLAVNRTNEEESGGVPPGPARPADLPRQREELKKDLLEAIKRKISKTKPGGDERGHQGSHKLSF